jgi:hypothetical protein
MCARPSHGYAALSLCCRVQFAVVVQLRDNACFTPTIALEMDEFAVSTAVVVAFSKLSPSSSQQFTKEMARVRAHEKTLFSEACAACRPVRMRVCASAGAGGAPSRRLSAICVEPLFASSSESWASRRRRALAMSLLHVWD